MKPRDLTIPEIALIGGTRAARGAWAALLLADKLGADQRRAVGRTLLLVGAISAIALVLEVLGKSECSFLWTVRPAAYLPPYRCCCRTSLSLRAV
jgi:hypothetical protein